MADDAATAPARGRGRPPKAGGPATPKTVVLNAEGQPRKRGRPPKNGGPVTPKTIVLDADGQPRKRGRPPKNGIAAQTKPKSEATSPAPTDQVRKRGRPRKAEYVTGDAENAPAPPRGRPRKDDVTAARSNGAVKGTPGRGRGRPPANPLQKFVGSYAIECPIVSEEWPDKAESMDISISTSDMDPCGLIASFTLGIVEGTMLLAATEEALDAFQSKVEHGSDHESDEDAECDEPPPKKIRSAPNDGALRLYFKWRGRDTTGSEIYDGSMDLGTIEFLDGKAIQFKGEGGFPAMGSDCKFTGTRYDNEATTVPLPWSTFSDKAAQEANEARW
ncbi:hypothetical protein MaudCBS49596_005255 [Microsporum audouinii]